MNGHIVVVGGSGFVGRHICRQAGKSGFSVVSVSRSGKPAGEEEVATTLWVAADVFAPDNWREYLTGCKAVVHCVGIIDEQPGRGVTYKRVIVESAGIVGAEAQRANVPKFVFLSAGSGAPDTPVAYMKSKLAAEAFLTSLGLELAILRPGLIYGQEKPETLEEHQALLELMQDTSLAEVIRPNRPMAVERVAYAALQAAICSTVKGILTVDDMEAIAG